MSFHEGDPLRYMVTARIGSPSGGGELLEKVDVGHSLKVYVGNQQYIVRLLETRSSRATFSVLFNRNSQGTSNEDLPQPDKKIITIESGKSGTSDGITISVIGTSYEGNPLRYKVTARIGTPNGAGPLLEKEDVGHSAEVHVGKRPYIVRLLGAESSKATFFVSIKK